MNYRQALQLKHPDGTPGDGILWHYTVTNDGRTRAEGYCSPLVECPDCKGKSSTAYRFGSPNDPPDCATCSNRGLVMLAADKACPGHDTAEGAQEHYKEYLLDTAYYEQGIAHQQFECEVCGAWTSKCAQVGPGAMETHMLCDEHRNREHLTPLVSVGSSASSY